MTCVAKRIGYLMSNCGFVAADSSPVVAARESRAVDRAELLDGLALAVGGGGAGHAETRDADVASVGPRPARVDEARAGGDPATLLVVCTGGAELGALIAREPEAPDQTKALRRHPAGSNRGRARLRTGRRARAV